VDQIAEIQADSRMAVGMLGERFPGRCGMFVDPNASVLYLRYRYRMDRMMCLDSEHLLEQVVEDRDVLVVPQEDLSSV
jgi:hypothetical protein